MNKSLRLSFLSKLSTILIFAVCVIFSFCQGVSAQVNPYPFNVITPTANESLIQGSVYRIKWSG